MHQSETGKEKKRDRILKASEKKGRLSSKEQQNDN